MKPSYVTNAPAAAHLYLQGEGLVAIAEQLGISVFTVRQGVLEAGVELRGPGRPRTHPVSAKHPSKRDPRLSVPSLRRKAPRNAEVLALRAEGRTLAVIGERFGISRERVRQIVKEAA